MKIHHALAKSTDPDAAPNRRLTERVPADMALVYSGMAEGTIVMGDGTVTNLSERGVGICGAQMVKHGMELALFIQLPNVEDPICIAESRVSWVSGRRFGVEVTSSALNAQNELRFHVWNHLSRSARKG